MWLYSRHWYKECYLYNQNAFRRRDRNAEKTYAYVSLIMQKHLIMVQRSI